ncbi:MAG TPA: NADP-specific glutamate dehydrogenase, partial [Gammaproteobacteria bacterium]|nr:NADP-specific glutamate dehydrogenase [Gammaproteobacteria bacterium]
MGTEIDEFLRRFSEKNPHEPNFNQAVDEFVRSVMPVYLDNRNYRDAAVLERLTEPDRVIQFRVPWKDDDGNIRIQRGWRVQYSNCLGPYKGGLRFDEGVTLDALKFLAFEQTLKNSLTGLPMGGAKGGSNFDPKGKSQDEIMRFCESLMVELYRYIGDDVDVPAGDIGVGSREIGYLFGHYLRLQNTWSGILTGKGCSFGGSAGRPEATGYGCVRFCRAALRHAGDDLEGKRIAISGSGTVALYAAEKALDEGAVVVALSDSRGLACRSDGISREQLDELIRAKEKERCTLREFAKGAAGIEYHDGRKSWSVECDIAMPCATENELNAEDAKKLIDNGVRAVCEGANMPCTAQAKRLFRDADILFAPGKAANAGGVAVSGMEITQNAMRRSWSREKVDEELHDTMSNIHRLCVEHGSTQGGV